MKRLLSILTAAALWVLPSLALADYQDGRDAFERGDYPTALKEFQNLANQQDAFGQYGLGVMYDMGEGVPQNSAEAAKWYRLAAEQGHADAQNNLGVMYERGEGVPRNYGEAMRWYLLAAEHGNADAPNNLGAMYMAGVGVPRDKVQAYMWFHIAGNGDPDASSNRRFIEKQMTFEEIAKAQRLADDWTEKHGKN